MDPVERNMPVASPRLKGLTAYRSPAPAAPVDLLLNGNEGLGPEPGLTGLLAELEPDVLRRYPDPYEFEQWLAGRLHLKPDRVLVTAGGDDAIDRICRAYLDPGRTLVMPTPSFVMIPRYTRLAGAELVEIPWTQGPYPVAEIIDSCDERTGVICVVSPNNPTGASATPDDLARLSAACPSAVLMVDLAYTEFAEQDLMESALKLKNAVCIRSLSKAWGLAGCRVGYAVGAREIVSVLRSAGGPYAVSRPSLALAKTRLEWDGDRVSSYVEQVRRERADLFDLFQEQACAPLPSEGNFVTARPANPAWLRDGLSGLGISIRLLTGLPGLGDCVRVSCPGHADDFGRLARGLQSVLAPQAVLFDMDGVVADVSGSYRQAIEQTAAHFGLDLAPGEVAAFKSAGGANNDWQVTHDLLARHGIECSLEQVTERFEELYQGANGVLGLRERESLIPSLQFMKKLAARIPLGVVTGRPRADAERFLKRFQLSELFQEVITMEDGPLKPDPRPVLSALERMGVQRAWMIGDTPDDLRAAREAGVVPLAVVAPGDDRARQAPLLTAAGAARVLDKLDELLEVLP